MKKLSNYLLAAFVAFAVLAGCVEGKTLEQLSVISENMKSAFAPDRREKVYDITFEKQKGSKSYIARGITTESGVVPALIAAAASQGITLTDSVTVLPDPALGESVYGVTSLSVVSHRYEPRHASESATQTLMGTPLRILQERGGWSMVKTPEGYIAWAPSSGVQAMDGPAYEKWMAAPKVIINKHYTLFREQALPGAPVVSDGVWGNIVELEGQTPLYYRVKLPNGKQAYVSRFDAEPFREWAMKENPMPEQIISTSLQFMGFPYLWAGTSVKAMDCSGLVKNTYFLNGVILLRDASQQARMGEEVNISEGWQNLQMGDLIFFGRKA
ncbi:MAG TPA: NlpC/P60 family protein, partial [Bacteroidales bacterium]|nr:NlpC/P60 family protein [Bacteroidales bacterium]